MPVHTTEAPPYVTKHGQGILVIPESRAPKFKHLLVAYYEERNELEMLNFMKEKCWRLF